MIQFQRQYNGKRLSTICATIILLASVQSQAASAKGAAQPAAAGECATVTKVQAPSGRNRLAARILIHARPEVVWETVHEERRKDPDLAYSKILSHENNQIVLEQKFVLLPVIGTAKCVMKDTEIPNERIDYTLIESDHFKAMEGSWILTTNDSGRSTVLELQSYLELGFPVPRMVLDGITSQKLQHRLANVKLQAEKAEANKVAETKPSAG